MPRFLTRDVRWLILVVALALNWWLDRKLNWEPIVAEWKAERAQRKSGAKAWDWQALDIPIFARREVAEGWYTWAHPTAAVGVLAGEGALPDLIPMVENRAFRQFASQQNQRQHESVDSR